MQPLLAIRCLWYENDWQLYNPYPQMTESQVFLLQPDIGTARCDFPGGSAEQMYTSIHKMYKLWPNGTRIYVGHDYPPATSLRTVSAQMVVYGCHGDMLMMMDLAYGDDPPWCTQEAQQDDR